MPEGKEPPQEPPGDDQEEHPAENVTPADELARRQHERAEEEHAADETVDSLIRGLSGPRPSAEDLLRELGEDPEIQKMQEEQRQRQAREAAGQPPSNVTPIRPPGESAGETPPEPPTKPQGPTGGGTPGSGGGSGGTPSGGA